MDLGILLVLAGGILAAFALRRERRRKGKSCCGCCAGCSGCEGKRE